MVSRHAFRALASAGVISGSFALHALGADGAAIAVGTCTKPATQQASSNLVDASILLTSYVPIAFGDGRRKTRCRRHGSGVFRLKTLTDLTVVHAVSTVPLLQAEKRLFSNV
ncbi:ribosomal protein S14 [Xanthomonas translucens]